MRYRLMATYRGVPYEAGVGPSQGDVVLFAACPPPEELGFEPATGHWRKQVIWAEVDGLWESRPVGAFRGEPCIVLDDLGDRLHIAYLGTDADRAVSLGYWQVDRGVFELLTPRDEVTSLTEERVEKPLRWTPPSADPPSAGPRADALAADRLGASPPPAAETAPTYPYRTASWPAPPTLLSPATLPAPAEPWASATIPVSAGPALNGAASAGAPGAMVNGSAAQAGSDVPLGAPFPAEPFGARPGAPGSDPAGELADGSPGEGLAGGGLAGGVADPRARETTGGRSARRQRVTTRDVFCELADLAAIPRGAYALEAEVDGAMCLLAGADGYEVFLAVDGARHEVRSFPEEEAAYFYLFGVLAAEAIRNRALLPAAVSEPDHRL